MRTAKDAKDAKESLLEILRKIYRAENGEMSMGHDDKRHDIGLRFSMLFVLSFASFASSAVKELREISRHG